MESWADQTWWLLKYILVVVGGFAAGRWAGVVVNARVESVVPETIATYPIATTSAFLVFGVAVVHALDEILTGD